jgi:hypothetical protein
MTKPIKTPEETRWIKSSERLPDENVAVLVFIPEEDNHCTTGMWDVSQEWVLLDEYRVPKSEVTYWAEMVDLPEDRSYKPSGPPEEFETMTETISRLQREIYDLKLSAI